MWKEYHEEEAMKIGPALIERYSIKYRLLGENGEGSSLSPVSRYQQIIYGSLQTGQVLIAEDYTDNNPVGIICWGRREKEKRPTFKGPIADISFLAIDEEHRNGGLTFFRGASILVRGLFRKGIKTAIFATPEDNTGAIKLYDSIGTRHAHTEGYIHWHSRVGSLAKQFDIFS